MFEKTKSLFGLTDLVKDLFGLNPTEIEKAKSINPQMAYMWEVEFKGMFSDDAENMKFYAQSTGVPAIMTDTIKRRYAGVEYAYAGKNNSPKIFRVTFWDDQNLRVYKYFQKWMFTMNDPVDGRGVRPEKYMREISLKIADVSGKTDETTERFVFKKCFPTEISEATLSYESSTVMTFDVLFHFSKRGMGDLK